MRKLLPILLLLVPSLLEAAPESRRFQTEFLTNLQDVSTKLERLAAATPADKYTWRPSPEVRSISEVYMHIAGSNYFLGTFLGKQPPAGIPENIEAISEKARVAAELARSFEHLRALANSVSDGDLDKPVKMFGTNTTQRGVLLTVLSHLHEHLGQSIAYARMNGVVPPWSD